MNWHSYFRAIQYRAPRLAQRNPEQGLVESNVSGKWLLYHWSPFQGVLQPLGIAAEMPSHEISPDGLSLFYFQDEKGNDFGHYVCRRLNSGETVDLTPDLPPYNSFAIMFSRGGSHAGFTRSTEEGFYVCVVDLDTDERPVRCREIYHTRSLTTCPWLSADGILAALASNQFSKEMSFAFGLVVLDIQRGEVAATLWDGSGSDLNPMMRAPFSPVSSDPRILTRTNRSGYYRPVIWNPCTGDRLDLAFEDREGDILPRFWSPDGHQILLEHLDRAVQQFGIFDMENGSTRWLDLPSGVYDDMQFWKNGQVVAQWEDLSHPPRVVAIYTANGKVVPLLSNQQEETGSCAWQSITFPSSDDQRVQAWLALPGSGIGSASRGPFPTIIEAHGGPEEVQMNGYHPEALAWLERGFAFASVNYRGSTTFGKAFQDQIKGDYGHWELEDLAACRGYLVRQGIADPERVFLTGYCFGGYLTLLALGKQPDLWRGGLAGAPIADWRVLYEDTLEAGRQMALATFGGSPEERPEQYQRASAVTFIQHVRAPVFIWMGAQDSLITTRQVEEYIARLRALGKRVDTAWYTGGHVGPVDAMEEQIDILARKMEFVESV